MGEALGAMTVYARKAHRCFLCPLPIVIGEMHGRWGWLQDGQITTIRVHAGCKAYAESMIPAWTDEGCEEYAALADLRDRLVMTSPSGVEREIDDDEATKLRSDWPGIGPLIDYIVAEVNDGGS